MKHETNPFNKSFYIGKRSRYIPVEGLSGVTDEGEIVRDNVYIKREQVYDKRKFAKWYIDAMDCSSTWTINGWRVFKILTVELGVKVDYVWMIWKKDYGISRSGFSRGMKELIETDVLAKSEQNGKYWINLNVVNRG